ncbi:MAG TPA: cyclic nucleotide-binding domain-containing protein [Polyangia bacterium]|nr:cyclic nucleotide-binding domain-containing protein [Polyangia bacterium]
MDADQRRQAREVLAQVPIFGGLPDSAMDRLLDLMKRRAFAAGETICAEGERAGEMFVVHVGAVEVRKRARDGSRETCLAQLRAGDCFGEMALIDIQPRSASVIACAPTELYVLSNMDLYALYQEDLASYTFFLQNLCRELSRRLRKADGALAE